MKLETKISWLRFLWLTVLDAQVSDRILPEQQEYQRP